MFGTQHLSIRGVLVIVMCLAAVQAVFAFRIRHIDPARDYLSPVPSPAAQDALAFGDPVFLHRLFALSVQSAGDTGGRIVPIRNYDFGRVVGWLEVLQRLDPRSEFAAGMAAGYFGLSQDVGKVEPVVRFLMRHVAINPQLKWRWLYNAVYLARHRLEDDKLALEAAWQLASYDFDSVDPMATMTPAFILEDMGDYQGATAVARHTLERFGGRMKPDDTAWTRSYLQFLSKVEAGQVRPRRRSFQ